MHARIVALCWLLASAAYAADDVPGWLKELTSVSVPQYGPKVNSAMLFNEEHTVVDNSGKLTTTTRTAIKFITRQGLEQPVFFEEYDTASDKVRDFRAWMIPSTGRVKKYGKDEILDVACAENDVYNQCRRRVVSSKRDADVGAVFGYEATVERQSFSNQLLFRFQDSMPVRMARFEVTVPPGWEIKTASFNGAPREAAAGNAYTWQMDNLPAIEREPASPSFITLVPWVGVNLLGGSGSHPLGSWPQAAKLLTDLNDGPAQPNDAIAAKAKALTAGATTEIEKIRALGRFAQQVNYVSIQLNISRGGGYRPHDASQVFQKLYGDCKDKANLMRALLKAVGITAFPVAIYSGDRTHVSAEWPSLGAFNHAISAIRVGPDTSAPAILEHPKMGRLLFFDPTDPYVPVGYLPDHEQASLALVGAGEDGDLVRVPAGHTVAGAHERHIEATLNADGSIDGAFVERRTGEALPDAVAAYHASSKTDYTKMIERWVGQSVPGSTTDSIEIQETGAEFILKGKFSSHTFAQRPQPRMLIFRAASLRHGDLRLIQKTRMYPVVINADAIHETVRISLPAGFNVDELPPRLRLNSPFGQFEATWSVDAGTLTFERKLEMQAQSVPPKQYDELKQFLDAVGGAPESPVVLVK